MTTFLRYFPVLFFINISLPLFGYVVDGSAWEQDESPVILLADAHIPGQKGIEHREALIAAFEQCQTPTTVILEQATWLTPQGIINNTLPDIGAIVAEEPSKYDPVTIINGDVRGPTLSSVTIFCDRIENLYSQHDYQWSSELMSKVKKIQKQVDAQWGVATLKTFKEETQELLHRIDTELKRIDLKCVRKKRAIIEQLFHNIVKNVSHDHAIINNVIYNSLEKSKNHSTKSIHTYFIMLDQHIADLGFMMHLLNRNQNHPCILFAGKAHIDEINPLLQELEENERAMCIKSSGASVDVTSCTVPEGLTVAELQELLKPLNQKAIGWWDWIGNGIKNSLEYIETIFSVYPVEN